VHGASSAGRVVFRGEAFAAMPREIITLQVGQCGNQSASRATRYPQPWTPSASPTEPHSVVLGQFLARTQCNSRAAEVATRLRLRIWC
jgi:hypothetical protein